ncbi:MAG TPA: CusA/CzcA family heavy metal efflux RND transporter [Stellaceae bacterium]|nr:CusA/CzcA family heavy metal efflux RND transporter [Stellaceae bacterium]
MSQIVAFALKRRVLVVLLLVFLFGAGLLSFARLDIEAYPDPLPPFVEVVTLNPGQSAAETERYITIPLEVQLSGVPHLSSLQSISLFGLSDIVAQFTYAFTYDEARQWVINRLAQLGPLPNGAQPDISEDSPIGEIYRYRVVGPGYSLTDLKTIEDWILERRFRAVPGIADVTGWGGKTKTYEVGVDQNRLVAAGLSVPQVLSALNNSNADVGGQTVNFGPQAAVVRGLGLIRSMAQIRNTMLSANNGSPVRIGDIAEVTVGHEPRLGIAGQDNDNDIVEGIVLMHRGEKALPVVRRVEAEVQKLNAGGTLPPGVHLETLYDFKKLILVTTRTVLENVTLGILLIFFVQWLFLGDLKSAVVVAATIPFALFFAVTILVLRGESANLLSVGAIDFGLIVDATVIMVENIFRHLREGEAGPTYAPAAPEGEAGLSGKALAIFRAAGEVNQAIFFSAAIILAGFVPLFTLSGVEGHIFGPMARTYGYAILGGVIATFTVSPALSALLLPAKIGDIETRLVRRLRGLYRPVLEFALANRILSLGGILVLAAAAALAARVLGLSFLPHLEEGNLWIRATMPQSVSLEEAAPYVDRMRRVIKGFPEVETVVSQDGRPDDGTDAFGPFVAEFYAPLADSNRWPAGTDKARLVGQMDAALKARFPGVDFEFAQYLQDNIDEVLTGVKGENAVKLFGHNLAQLGRTARAIERVLRSVPGIADLDVGRELGQPTVEIRIDRRRAARYGLAPGDINATVQAAIGGQAAGNLFEEHSDRNFPIVVRLAPHQRKSLDAIRHIMIGAPGPSGDGIVQIPLADVAKVDLVSGASYIYRQNQERYIPIKFSVRGRPLGSTVLEAQRRIAREVKLPAGYRIEWVGEFGELQQALKRLEFVVPVSLALIALLLFANFGSLTDTLLAASVMPMAWIGGIFALLVTGTPFSVSAAIGFVGLFGISVMEGIIILSYFNALIDAGLDRAAAVTRACHIRLRPVMMTCLGACVGLLPAALSTGIGSQVQKPLALVIVGGTLLAPLPILIVLPVLIDVFSRRERDAARQPQPAPGG